MSYFYFIRDMARAQASIATDGASDQYIAIAQPATAECHESQEAAPEGFGTLIAQSLAAEIAVDVNARERRVVREALAETQRRLARPGRVFSAA